MKVSIEVPDELDRRVKAKAALLGRTVRNVTVELFQTWLDEESRQPAKSQAAANNP